MENELIIVRNKVLTWNRVPYFWGTLFILPLLFANIFQCQIVIRNIHYFWVVFFLIYCYYYRDLLKNSLLNFSNRAIFYFFSAVLISLLYAFVGRYYTFQLNYWDVGIFQNMLIDALGGNFGYASLLGFYHFATHQNYILFLLLPFYKLFASTVFLQTVLALVITATGFVLYLIALNYVSQFVALLITISFYLSPFAANADNFRPEYFLPLFFACAYYCYIKQKFSLYLLAIILCLSVKEDASLYILGFAIYLLLIKDYKYFFITLIFSALIIYLNLIVLQPYFVAKNHTFEPSTLVFYRQWGSTKRAIVSNMLYHPNKIIGLILNYKSGFWHLYLPILLFPLADLMVFCSSIFAICLNATSNADRMYSYHLAT